MKRAWHGLACALVATAVAPAAHADATRAELEEASQLFQRGVAAQKRGDVRAAAAAFASADALVPDPAALEAALRAAVAADDPALGMTLVDRAERRAALEGTLATAAQEARSKLAGRAAAIVVRCASCSAWIDGNPATPGSRQWVAPGDHQVAFQVGGAPIVVRAEAGREAEVSPPESPASAPPAQRPDGPRREAPPPAPPSGVSPAWFWAGAGVTAVAGGITIGLAVRTRSLHDSFATEQGAEQSAEIAGEGRTSQNVTNALALSTVVLGLATAAIGIFAVDWKPDKRAVSRAVSLSPGAARATLGGRF